MDWLIEASAPLSLLTGAIVLAGRFMRQRLGRRGRLAVLLTVALLCVGIGVVQYLNASSDVSSGQALEGALLAAFGFVAIPFGSYLSIGYWLRSTTATVVAWVVASLPIAGYLLFLALAVASLSDCPPNAYECPI